jgi:hypothetical protein
MMQLPDLNQDKLPWERFMSHDPRDQPSIINRPDNGQLSISRDCTCIDALGDGFLDLQADSNNKKP